MASTTAINAVTQDYTNILFRSGSTGDINAWAALIDNGTFTQAQMAHVFSTSVEATQYVDPIIRLYQAAFNRAPESAATITAWAGNLKTIAAAQGYTAALNAVSQAFVGSAEFTSVWGSYTGTTLATGLYHTALGRDGSAADIGALASMSAAQLLSAFATSTEFVNNSASTITTWLESNAATTTFSTATLQIGGNATNLNPGTTFAMTTGVDNIAGTALNDTINGLVDYTAGAATTTANTTFQLTDVITGGAGTDTLNITVTGAATGPNAGVTLPAATVSGVEIINVRAVTGSGQVITVNGGNFSGHTVIAADRATDQIAITNLASGAAVGIIGNGVITNGTLGATYVNAATVSTLNVSGGTTAGAVTIAGAGVTSAVVNSTGAANVLTSLAEPATATSLTIHAATNLTTGAITGAALTSVTVDGAAASVNLSGGLAATTTTVNATGMTAGGVTATLLAGITSFKGGAGNDVVTTTTLTATTAGEIDAGGGTANKLIVAAAADINSTTKGAEFVNFQVLQNTVAAALDVSTVAGITSIELNANGAGAQKLTATQAAAVTNLVDNAGATLALATATGTSDVLTVTLKNTVATTSASLTNVTVNGFETMNVAVASGAVSGTTDTLSFAAADSLTALTLTGASPLALVATNIAKAVTIDATGLTNVPATGNYALTESGTLIKGSVVTGTAQADSFTLAAITGTAGDYVTINGGAGNDLFSTTAAILNNTSAANGSFKLDGGAGTDTLSFSEGGVTLTDANFQYVTNFEAIKVAAAGAVNIVSGGFFDTNFKTNGVTITATSVGAAAASIDLTSFTGKATVNLTSTPTTQNTLVNGGSNDDTITVDAHTATTGNLTIAAGAGNDTIKVTSAAGTLTTGVISIDGGAGQDTITIVSGPSTTKQGLVTLVEHAGQSTVAAADAITGFALADGTTQSYTLDFDGTATVQANAAGQSVTGYTSAQLTYTINNGLISFAGTSASSLTAATEAALVQAIVTTADKAVAFTFTNADATVDTYVFEHNTGGDSLVKLVGVTATGVEVAAGAHTTGYVTIA